MFPESETDAEVSAAYDFFRGLPAVPKISVFASSSLDATDSAWGLGKGLGQEISGEGFLALTGGREGLMGAVIEGANSLIPGSGVALFCRPGGRTGKTSDGDFVFGQFSLRKQFFLGQAEGIVVLPGGFGTLDELFFWLALTRLDPSCQIPAVLLDDPERPFWSLFWNPLLEKLFERKVVRDTPPVPAIVFSAKEALALLAVNRSKDGRVSNLDRDQGKG